jgi:hypothetical protein
MGWINDLRQEASAIKSAPWSFVISIAACMAAIFGALDWRYGAKIDRLNEEVADAKQTITQYRQKEHIPDSALGEEEPPPWSKHAGGTLPLTPELATISPIFIQPDRSVLLNPDRSKRIFVQVTPGDVNNRVVNKTQNQARTIEESYIGNWMAFTATVSDVSTESDGRTHVYAYGWKTASKYTDHNVMLVFDRNWKDKLRLLKKNELISVACRLNQFYMDHSYIMDQCVRFEP